MFPRTSLIAIAVAVLFTPRIAIAQQPEPPQASSQSAGPRLELTATGMQSHASADSSDAAAVQQRQNVGRPVALMVVGGAAIVLGAVIGDAPGALFMIGGAVAFLYGLYQYLK